MSLEYRGEVATSLTVGLGAPTNLQFEIGDLDIPDRASQNEIAFAAVDLSAEVLATRGVTPVEDRDHRTAAQVPRMAI